MMKDELKSIFFASAFSLHHSYFSLCLCVSVAYLFHL
jgi:hypothetical protein